MRKVWWLVLAGCGGGSSMMMPPPPLGSELASLGALVGKAAELDGAMPAAADEAAQLVAFAQTLPDVASASAAPDNGAVDIVFTNGRIAWIDLAWPIDPSAPVTAPPVTPVVGLHLPSDTSALLMSSAGLPSAAAASLTRVTSDLTGAGYTTQLADATIEN